MDKLKKDEIRNLEELCKPISDYLKENYDPYCQIIISDTSIRLVRDEIGIPVRDND